MLKRKEFGALLIPEAGAHSSPGRVYPNGFVCPHGSHGIWAALSPEPCRESPQNEPPSPPSQTEPGILFSLLGIKCSFQGRKSSTHGVSLQAGLISPQSPQLPTLPPAAKTRVGHFIPFPAFFSFPFPLKREIKLEQELCRCLPM